MTDLRCPISRAELDDALSIGASGVFCAALIDNPHLIEDDLGVDSERLSAEQHALVCMMSLEANFLQDGVDCLLWRLGRRGGLCQALVRLGGRISTAD